MQLVSDLVKVNLYLFRFNEKDYNEENRAHGVYQFTVCLSFVLQPLLAVLTHKYNQKLVMSKCMN